MEDHLYLTWWLNLVTDKRFLSNYDINDQGNIAISLGTIQNANANSVQCQLVIEATMRARQRWSKNNALAEICRGEK